MIVIITQEMLVPKLAYVCINIYIFVHVTVIYMYM